MTNLISAEGLKKLCDEYDYLWKVERPKVVRGVSDAAAEGDRSENAEYIYGKKRLREIDRKLKHNREHNRMIVCNHARIDFCHKNVTGLFPRTGSI